MSEFPVLCSACEREFAAVLEPSQVGRWVADCAHPEADALALLRLQRSQLLHEPRRLLSLPGPHCQVTLDGQIGGVSQESVELVLPCLRGLIQIRL